MSFFRWRKNPVAAEVAGRNLTNHIIDANDCWRDVCALRSYSTDETIATCEMAFARAALVKHFLKDGQPNAIEQRIDKAADELIIDAFGDQDTDVTLQFYGEPLKAAALKRVALYEQHAFMTSQLGAALGKELRVSGVPSLEIGQLFDELTERMKQLTAKIRLV